MEYSQGERGLLAMSKEFYIIKEDKIFLVSNLDGTEREIGSVKKSEEETIEYFTQRFAVLVQKVCDLEKDVNKATNKGSYLMKLIHLTDSLSKYNGIGDFLSLKEKLDAVKITLEEGIDTNRIKNVEIKKELLGQLAELIKSDNWTDDIEVVKGIQLHWNKTGKADPEEEQKLSEAFKESTKQFFNKAQSQLSERQQELVANRIQSYKFIIDDAQTFLNGKIKDHVDEFKALQSKWREQKEVPTNVYEPLLEKFKELGNQFFDKLKSQKKPINTRRQPKIDPYAEWEKLSNKAESLYKFTAFDKAVNEAKHLQRKLRDLKYTSRKRGFRGEGKFRAACEYVFERHYLERKIRERITDYDQLNEADQQKEKVKLLRFLIGRDQEEINQVERNKEEMVIDQANSDFAKMVNSRLTTFSRKLKAKQRIMEELTQ